MVLLGIDFGTGGCKVTAIDATGRPLGDASVEYPTAHLRPGWSEQKPADWYPAMCAALKRLRERVDFSQIGAVAFDGATHSAVLLDDNFSPVRDTILWTDQRSVAECAELKHDHGDRIFQLTYQLPAPTWTLPQLIWLRRHEPEVLKRTRHLLFVKDYVRYLVTGVPATDHIEAQVALCYDMAAKGWSDELIALSGLPRAAFPELLEPAAPAGVVTAAAARDTGIPAGTQVICGASDSAVEDYGAGAVEPGDLIVKLATAGNVNVMTASPHPGERTLTYSHVVPGLWYTVSATNAAALCARWFRDQFGAGSSYAELDLLAEASPPGANGVFFHPYLQGERSPYWDAALRGSFTGVGINATKGDFIRALYEGVAYSLADCRGVIEAMRLPVKRVFLIGGGAKSALWSRIVCDLFNLPLCRPQPGDASFGAALLASVGAGVFPDAATAARRIERSGTGLTPDPANAAFYAEQFKTYQAIHDALAPIYARRAN